jgi:peptidoglycan/xylan/chitin deacetylase (PgdA/CDA1 family)
VNKDEVVFNADTTWSFEASISDLPSWLRPELAIENTTPANQVQLYLGESKQQAAIALTGPWGGVVLQPALFLSLPEGQRQWLLDPIKLLHQWLQLADLPVADITTENGRRIMTSHIDGDGFVSRAKFPGSPLAGEVMHKQLIEHYQLPITVSVIEGEVGPTGLYPKESAAAEALAREIFAKPYVEVASHSYSHPFYWNDISPENSLDYGYHLPIKNYQLSVEREVVGSIKYINEHLTTAEKPVSIMLWTGGAMPGAQAIAYTKKMGVLNVNGGNTKLVNGQASLTNLWPIGRPLKQGIQVYAPIMNENVYTELWKGAHFGYQRVLETYQLTDQPRRYKPVSIYYHFYSAEDPAGIRALKRVYDGVLAQHIFPMYLSDYARKAEEFYHYGLAKTPGGEWFTKLNQINTLRIPKNMGLPLLNDTNHVIGYKHYNDSVYVHLNQNVVQVAFRETPPNMGYLVSSSATLKQWKSQRTNKHTEISFVADSYLPFELVLSHPGQCQLSVDGIEYQSQGSDNKHHFQLSNAVKNQLMAISCQ